MAVTQDLNITPLAGTDPYDLSVPQNAKALSARINRNIHVDRFQRQQFEREWFRNVLFYVGNHWIIFDRGKWRPKNLPSWFPRAMTNKFAEKINDFVTTLTQNGRVPINYLPTRADEDDDKAICEISEVVRTTLYEEANIDDESPTLAAWIGMTGNGFLLPYYDHDEKHGTYDIELQQCQACKTLGENASSQAPAMSSFSSIKPDKTPGPVSDVAEDGPENSNPPVAANPPANSSANNPLAAIIASLTGPAAGAAKQYTPQDIVDAGGKCPVCGGVQFVPATNDDGSTAKQSFNKGKFCTDICSPFEIRIDHRITKWEDHKKFTRMKMIDLDEAKQKYPDIAVHITADHENDLGQFYLNALAHVTAAFGITGGFVGGAANPQGPKTVVYEHFELPDQYYPKGIRCTRIGANSDLIVEAGPLDTSYGAGPMQGKKFLPLVKFGFDRVPGRMWGKTRADDVVPLQLFRNIVEASLRLTAQRMSNALWLNPKGSGVEILTGEPGQVIPYNPVSVGGTSFAKPERVPAELSNVGPLIMLMNKIDDSIERVMGTFFLQGGETPPGVTAASALAYLGEKAQRSMSGPVREWAHGWQRWEEMALEIFRANADDERILTIAGKNRVWETQKFSKAELTGSVKMRVDYNGLFPKSQAMERATVAQLTQLGFVVPGDPETDFRVLEIFGETGLKGSVDVAVREAVKENEKFMADETYMPKVVPFVQNSQVHMMIHLNLPPTDEFKNLPPERQQVFFQHVQDTVFEMTQRQRLFAEMAQPPQGGPGATPPDGSEQQPPDKGSQPGAAPGQPRKPGQPAMPNTPDMASNPGDAGGGGAAQESPLPDGMQ